MKEKAILKFCVVVSMVGIFLMVVANKFSKQNEIRIGEIKEEINNVKISGQIKDKYVSKTGTVFLKIFDGENSINGVAFKGTNTENIQKGDFVEVVGNVQRYKGELEIIIKSIKKL